MSQRWARRLRGSRFEVDGDLACPRSFRSFNLNHLNLNYSVALFVPSTRLEGFHVRPANGIFTFLAGHITHDVPSGGRVVLPIFGEINIDGLVEKVCFAVLTSEVLHENLTSAPYLVLMREAILPWLTRLRIPSSTQR